MPGRSRVVVLDGLRVMSPTDTWVALAEELTVEQLVAVGDALVPRTGPLCTMDELSHAVVHASGRRGAKRLRLALELVRPRTDSPRETRLRLQIVGDGLPEPVVNFPILDDAGGFVAFGDLAYPEYRVLVEYDGGQHFGEAQTLVDVDRLEKIMALRWRVVRINKTHARATAVALVRAALVQAGYRA